jgi:AcrR family transcriptional regulator
MSGLKTVLTAPRGALEPQRRPGKLRVAALMQAGAQVIAERGYEAATMAEIAARAGAPIGSLYRFFPSKDVLADALMRHYVELIDAAFEKVDYRGDVVNTAAFADALLTSLVELRGETQAAVVALLDARSEFSARRSEFYDAIRGHILRVLTLRDPGLDPRKAEAMTFVLLQNMKTMKSLQPDADADAIAELHAMTRLYLQNALGG